MKSVTLKSKLLAVQEGMYVTLIFEDLNRDITDELKYITCTKLPNWNYHQPIRIGDKGYLECIFTEAGETQWYDKTNKRFEVYNYSNCYFINFIKIKDEINTKEYKF